MAVRRRGPRRGGRSPSRSCTARSRRVRDLVAAFRLAGLIRQLRPHILHTHTAKAGAVGRVAALLAGVRPRPIVVHTFHGHVLRGYFGPLQRERLPAARAPARARRPTRSSPSARRCATTSSRSASRRAERFVVVRLGIELEERVGGDGDARARTRRLLGVPDDRFLVGWIGRMTAVKRTDDVLLAFKELRDARRRRGAVPRRRRPRPRPAWRSAPTSSASRATASRSATRTRSRTGTPPSTPRSSRRRTRARR